jgi:hypothetical protein
MSDDESKFMNVIMGLLLLLVINWGIPEQIDYDEIKYAEELCGDRGVRYIEVDLLDVDITCDDNSTYDDIMVFKAPKPKGDNK